MKKILITGATAGIGLATAQTLLERGHFVLLHGRNETKLSDIKNQLCEHADPVNIETYAADLSDFKQVVALANQVAGKHQRLDVLINNAGVYVVPEKLTAEGLDVRFVVNTIAPYLLTQKLLPCLGHDGRVINLSSAAQAPVDPGNIARPNNLGDGVVYAQSKLALTMWSRHLADSQGAKGPVIVAVNPASMLGSEMVKEAYGVAGGDLQIGADILVRAALSDEFANASGLYFDNDIGRFTTPHPDANDPSKVTKIMAALEKLVAPYI